MISQLGLAQLFYITLLVGGYAAPVDVQDSSCVMTDVNLKLKDGSVGGVQYTKIVSNFLGQPVYIRDRNVSDKHGSTLYQVAQSLNLLNSMNKQSNSEYEHYPSIKATKDGDLSVMLPLSSQGLREVRLYLAKVYSGITDQNLNILVDTLIGQINTQMMLKNEFRVLYVSPTPDLSVDAQIVMDDTGSLFFADILGQKLDLALTLPTQCISHGSVQVFLDMEPVVEKDKNVNLDILRMFQEELEIVASKVLPCFNQKQVKQVHVEQWWSSMYGSLPEIQEDVVSFLELHSNVEESMKGQKSIFSTAGYEAESMYTYKDVVPYDLMYIPDDHQHLAVDWLQDQGNKVSSHSYAELNREMNFLQVQMQLMEKNDDGEAEEEPPAEEEEKELPYLHEYEGNSSPIGDENGPGFVHSSTGYDIDKDESILSTTGNAPVPVDPGAFDACDMRTPMSNQFCPYPEPSQVVVNMASKILTMALIGPVIDAAARDWNRGQDSPITISEMIQLQMEQTIQPSKDSVVETVFTTLKERIRGNMPSDPYAQIVEQYKAKDQALARKRMLELARNGLAVDQSTEKTEYIQGQPVYTRLMQNKYTKNPGLLLKAYESYKTDILSDPSIDDKLKQYIAKHTGSTYISSTTSANLGNSFLTMDEALQVLQEPAYRENPENLPDREKLIPALKKNLYEQLVDPVTEALVEGITETTIMQGTPMVFDKVADIAKRYVPAGTAEALRAVLSTTIPMSVGLSTSDVVNRALPPYLIKTVTSGTVDTVTRAATHAMTYGLGMTLSHSPVVHYYCYYCKYWSHYCEECHDNMKIAGFNNVEYSYMYQSMYADHYTLMYRDFTLWEELQQDINQ